MDSGVYKIVSNLYLDRLYIGSTVNLDKRWKQHKRDLKNGSHSNKQLQDHYGAYGLGDLRFEIIEHCHEDILEERESYYQSQEIGKGVTVFSTQKIIRGSNTLKIYKMKTLTLRLEDQLHSRLSVMASASGLTLSTLIRVLLTSGVDQAEADNAKSLRSRILSGGEDHTQPKPEKKVEGLSSSPEAPSKQDWDALSFDARKPIVQAYRNKMRGNPYDAHLEPYFTFVENAQK